MARHGLASALGLAVCGATFCLGAARAEAPAVQPADPAPRPASAASAEPAALPRSGFAAPLEAIGIADIQRQLVGHGYDPGPATGAMSDATYRAILAYQRDYGLPADGVAGPGLQNALHFLPRRPAVPPAPAAPPPAPPAASMPAPSPPPAPAAVAPVPQAALAPPAPPDAPPSAPPPPAAVAALPPPPAAPPSPVAAPTSAGLAQDPAPKAAPRVPVTVGAIPDGAAVASAAPPLPAAPLSPAAMPAAAAADADTLKSDETVREAQAYLKELGFYAGDADGVFGWPTVEALIKFDASGAGPATVIADAKRPEDALLARLKTAAAAARAAHAPAR